MASRIVAPRAAPHGTGGSLIRLAPGDVFAGKLRLERTLASGGMGTVWRAWNTQLDVPVAVKVMAPSVAQLPGFVARFVREAKSAAKIRSPNVVTVFEHGVHEGLPYMVMELLEGEDLYARLKREEHLSLAATSRIVRDVCKALQRAHELSIVHRDLKPANIFLVSDGDEEVAKVLDFGIAKITGDDANRITATGELLGTPHYMSPEQVRASKHVDHRADLWAIGAITYRCLTGRSPFEGSTLELVQQILHDPVPSARKAAPYLPAAIDPFFAKAMAQAPGRRFQSARELSDALLAIAGSEPSVDAMAPGKSAPEPEDLATTVPMVGSKRPLESESKPTVPMGHVAPRAAPSGSSAAAESDASPLRPPLEPTKPMDVAELRREGAAPASLDAEDSRVVVARGRSPLVWIVVAVVLAALAVAAWALLSGSPPGV